MESEEREAEETHPDEPTGNVDDNIAVRLIQLFTELYKLGTSVVVATHNETLTARRLSHHRSS